MKVIDFEHHYFSKPYYDFLIKNKNKSFIKNNAEFGAIYTSFEAKSNNIPNLRFEYEVTCQNDYDLKVMEEAKMDIGVLSTSDGIEALPKKHCVELTIETNNFTAEKIKQHPDKFLGTFCLPTPFIEESLKEIDRATKLGLKYFHTHSSYGKTRLSDPQYEPIIKKCAELNIPIYIHPSYQDNSYFTEMGFAFSAAGFGFGVDVMKTFISLVRDGIFDRYPNLKIILGHIGEFFPYTIARMDNMIDMFKGSDPTIKCKHDFRYYVKHNNIYVTTSGIFDEEVVLYAIKVLGIDHILFGADFPYECAKRSVDIVTGLPISNEDKVKILFKNGEKLLGID